MPSEFSFATFANYSPRGQAEPSARSQRICTALKAGRASQTERALPRLLEPQAEVLQPFLNPAVVLVPVPRSAPLREDTLWPSKVIADVLCEAGYGAAVQPLVERMTAVPKSAYAAQGARPLIQDHKASMRVQADMFGPEQITLVDDVLTMGRTTVACAELLQEQFPAATVRIFAMLRTLGLQDEIETVFDPVVGTVTGYPSGKSFREP